MENDLLGAFEDFLVEHVMIGLGNIRASIDRLETSAGADPEARALALSRIGGQIDHLEARARALHGMFYRPDPVEVAKLFAAAVDSDRLVFCSRRGLN